MDPKRWARPVTFEENDRGGFRTISSTEEAARTLLERWPVFGTKAYREAREVALAVLMGEREPEDARAAFLAAAMDAKLYVRRG